MVLNDVVKEYEKLYMHLEEHCGVDSLLEAGFQMLQKYNTQCNHSVDKYMRSSKNSNDSSEMVNSLRGLVDSFSKEIATMNENVRKTTKLISSIERMDFHSKAVKLFADQLCEMLEKILDLTEEYASCKIKGQSTVSIFFEMIDKLSEIQLQYNAIALNYQFLCDTESELLETDATMPENDDAEEYYLDIRSNKKPYKINTFADDVKLLNECLNLFELVISNDNSTPIYMLKLESGSLFSKLKSLNIHLSVFPSIVKNFAEAFRTFKMTGAEVAAKKSEAELNLAEANKMNAEAESIRIDNKGKELEIVASQMLMMRELLQIDESNSEAIEDLQKFGLALIKYLKANPTGEVNDVKYDISEYVKLLEAKGAKEA